jgi:hypothetical protein
MKLIPLSQGQFAQVDDEDFEYLNQFKWYASKRGSTYYAIRTLNNTKASMHRVIMNASNPKILIDHKDHSGLNNQKTNLRESTTAQNSKNRIGSGNSKYLGVHLEKDSNKFVAQIRAEGKYKKIGRFILESDAAKAYNEAAIKYHGEFANLNIIN